MRVLIDHIGMWTLLIFDACSDTSYKLEPFQDSVSKSIFTEQKIMDDIREKADISADTNWYDFFFWNDHSSSEIYRLTSQNI